MLPDVISPLFINGVIIQKLIRCYLPQMSIEKLNCSSELFVKLTLLWSLMHTDQLS